MPPDNALAVRLAARALGRHGLAHAYGHVSARVDGGHFLVSPPQPLGSVAVGDPGVAVPLDGPLPSRALPEVRMHRAIYRRRPDVGGICRFQSPALMALSALGRTPRVLHGLGAYFSPCPPLWPGTALVRDDDSAGAVAGMLGPGRAIVLRGNGAVTAGASLMEAACLAFFLEDAARLEIALLPAAAGGAEPIPYTADEAAQRAVGTGGLFERMWHFLCAGDSEWQLQN
ncbi:class II aldolase/adducin family protein [Niveispirillum sp.]|uniref:class II aldolase/adducin family protein n=1 Tax=Niveispirillum TaxID=1543704 RepID=UPI001B7A19BA|nr:class II aldolase/adducin family protein [Niveispirillum sp.]MBP7335936.1 class II aldolase/adducin family protein [Niveispirillum sp.]